MILTVKIEGVDKSSLIEWSNFTVEDNANEQPNLCNFTIKVYGEQSYKPSVNDEVIITDENGNKIFAGRILNIKNHYIGKIIYYDVECKDYTTELDRILVIDSFENETVNEIIGYINTNYLTGITVNNVNCTTTIKKIVFNRKKVTDCLNDLAKLTNYIWYIDYDKDIHFIAKNSEVAPFSIEDDSQYLIGDTLELTNDLSQLRNVVVVRGADKEATNTRDKKYTTDGTKTTFPTSYKFAKTPTVTLDGTALSVGVENIDTSDYDCYWDYNQKYIRFDTAPASDKSLVITGYPLIPIIVQVEDSGSISKYGRFEFSKIDKSLKSSDDAKLYAETQLDSYGNSVREGSFKTYQSGLASGQTISINLTDLGVNDSFIIQRVSLSMISRTKGEWTIELATTRTMGIIKFLQDQLLSGKNIELNENDVLEKYYMDTQTIKVTEEVGRNNDVKKDYQDVNVNEDLAKDPFGAGVAPDFVLCPYTPTGQTDPKREFFLDRSYLG